MPGKGNRTTSPVSVRLTDDERAQLAARLKGRPLGEYIRERLFGPDHRPPETPGPPVLAQILAQLGQSDLGPSLRELGRAAKMGALPVTPEAEQAIASACRAIMEIRSALMRALGLKETPPR